MTPGPKSALPLWQWHYLPGADGGRCVRCLALSSRLRWRSCSARWCVSCLAVLLSVFARMSRRVLRGTKSWLQGRRGNEKQKLQRLPVLPAAAASEARHDAVAAEENAVASAAAAAASAADSARAVVALQEQLDELRGHLAAITVARQSADVELRARLDAAATASTAAAVTAAVAARAELSCQSRWQRDEVGTRSAALATRLAQVEATNVAVRRHFDEAVRAAAASAADAARRNAALGERLARADAAGAEAASAAKAAEARATRAEAALGERVGRAEEAARRAHAREDGRAARLEARVEASEVWWSAQCHAPCRNHLTRRPTRMALCVQAHAQSGAAEMHSLMLACYEDRGEPTRAERLMHVVNALI